LKSSASSLAAANEFDPQVVLLDIGLPDISGHEVARRLQERLPRSRRLLVALTGYGDEDDRQRSRQVGFDLHLTKPVDPEVLGRILQDFARQRVEADR
jgi:two-component system CheB/CheR fusion protein